MSQSLEKSWIVLGLLWSLSCQTPESPPSTSLSASALPTDNGIYDLTYYIDPNSGDDSKAGTSESSAWRSMANVIANFPLPRTKIAVKRGTVLRLSATLKLKGGASSGYVCYGAYGDLSLPKPILVGSIEITSWVDSGGGIKTFDWSPYLDTNDGRSATGVEQGPGNLWFFAGSTSGSKMLGWGWRKQTDISGSNAEGDWYYDAANKLIRLRITSNSINTEASVNRPMFSFAGQNYLIVEDWDVRYGGGYLFVGHEANHLKIRRIDMSFFGGGTKTGSCVRLGNGIETTGSVDDVLIEACRIHQAYDTGFDPQNVGSSAVSQKNLVYKNNIVSYAGLAGFELWMRPAGSQLENVILENNTFLYSGRGWGYAQHDHVGQGKVGADIVIFENFADGSNIALQKNVFHHSRGVLLSEFKDSQAKTKALLSGLTLDSNLWSLKPNPGAQLGIVLFKDSDPTNLVLSPTFNSLSSWQSGQSSVGLSGKDLRSVESDAQFANPSDAETQDQSWIASLTADSSERPKKFGPFALRGDYRRSSATSGVGWGANLAP